MTKRKPLQWYDDDNDRLGYPGCPDCFEYMMRPGMIEAAASVGIEYGKSTGLMLRDVVNSYHARGHKEPSRGETVQRGESNA